MRQRMLSALLAASMVLTMAPAAFAAGPQDFQWDNNNAYKLTEDTDLNTNYDVIKGTGVYTIDVDTYTLSVDTVTVNVDSGLVINSSNTEKGGVVKASQADGNVAFKVDGSLVLGPNVKFESPVGIYKLTPDTAATVAVAPVSRAVTAKVTNGEVTLQGGNYDEGLTIHQNVAATVPAGAEIVGEVAVQNDATLTVAKDGSVGTITVQAGANVTINGKVESLILPEDVNSANVTIAPGAEIANTQVGNTTSILVAVYNGSEDHGTVDIYSMVADTKYVATAMGTIGEGDWVGDLYSVRTGADAKLVAQVTPDEGYVVDRIWRFWGLDGEGEINGMQQEGESNTFVCGMPAEATSLSVFYENENGPKDPNPGNGGGGGSSASSYSVSVAPTENGTVTVSPKSASKGATVTITVTPDEGYELGELTVTDQNGNDIALTDAGDGKYTFTMPGSRVTVEATFVEFGTTLPFTDVASTAWYAEAVRYVYANGMMNGTSATQFSPNATTNRAMIVTILYRLEGSPAASASNFTDVVAGSYYADAVNWAAANGIVNGVTETSFAPTSAVTREQMAAILYRYAQFKGYDVTASNDLSSYVDASQISAYATTAMQWANAEGLITGSTSTTLNPVGNATRAEVATILMRFCENIAQ